MPRNLGRRDARVLLNRRLTNTRRPLALHRDGKLTVIDDARTNLNKKRKKSRVRRKNDPTDARLKLIEKTTFTVTRVENPTVKISKSLSKEFPSKLGRTIINDSAVISDDTDLTKAIVDGDLKITAFNENYNPSDNDPTEKKRTNLKRSLPSESIAITTTNADFIPSTGPSNIRRPKVLITNDLVVHNKQSDDHQKRKTFIKTKITPPDNSSTSPKQPTTNSRLSSTTKLMSSAAIHKPKKIVLTRRKDQIVDALPISPISLSNERQERTKQYVDTHAELHAQIAAGRSKLEEIESKLKDLEQRKEEGSKKHSGKVALRGNFKSSSRINHVTNRLDALDDKVSSISKALHDSSEKLSLSSDRDDSSVKGTLVQISNLHSKVTSEDIIELLSDIGPLQNVRLVRPGICEAKFVHYTDALDAIKKYSYRELDGKTMVAQIIPLPSDSTNLKLHKESNIQKHEERAEELTSDDILQLAREKRKREAAMTSSKNAIAKPHVTNHTDSLMKDSSDIGEGGIIKNDDADISLKTKKSRNSDDLDEKDQEKMEDDDSDVEEYSRRTIMKKRYSTKDIVKKAVDLIRKQEEWDRKKGEKKKMITKKKKGRDDDEDDGRSSDDDGSMSSFSSDESESIMRTIKLIQKVKEDKKNVMSEKNRDGGPDGRRLKNGNVIDRAMMKIGKQEKDDDVRGKRRHHGVTISTQTSAKGSSKSRDDNDGRRSSATQTRPSSTNTSSSPAVVKTSKGDKPAVLARAQIQQRQQQGPTSRAAPSSKFIATTAQGTTGHQQRQPSSGTAAIKPSRDLMGETSSSLVSQRMMANIRLATAEAKMAAVTNATATTAAKSNVINTTSIITQRVDESNDNNSTVKVSQQSRQLPSSRRQNVPQSTKSSSVVINTTTTKRTTQLSSQQRVIPGRQDDTSSNLPVKGNQPKIIASSSSNSRVEQQRQLLSSKQRQQRVTTGIITTTPNSSGNHHKPIARPPIKQPVVVSVTNTSRPVIVKNSFSSTTNNSRLQPAPSQIQKVTTSSQIQQKLSSGQTPPVNSSAKKLSQSKQESNYYNPSDLSSSETGRSPSSSGNSDDDELEAIDLRDADDDDDLLDGVVTMTTTKSTKTVNGGSSSSISMIDSHKNNTNRNDINKHDDDYNYNERNKYSSHSGNKHNKNSSSSSLRQQYRRNDDAVERKRDYRESSRSGKNHRESSRRKSSPSHRYRNRDGGEQEDGRTTHHERRNQSSSSRQRSSATATSNSNVLIAQQQHLHQHRNGVTTNTSANYNRRRKDVNQTTSSTTSMASRSSSSSARRTKSNTVVTTEQERSHKKDTREQQSLRDDGASEARNDGSKEGGESLAKTKLPFKLTDEEGKPLKLAKTIPGPAASPSAISNQSDLIAAVHQALFDTRSHSRVDDTDGKSGGTSTKAIAKNRQPVTFTVKL